MSNLCVSPVIETDFAAQACLEDGLIKASFSGNADLRFQEALRLFLGTIHDEASRLSTSEVWMDFRQLKFMNSSCFKNFVLWITELQEVAAERQYKIRFIANPTMHWQKRSLHALTCFAEELVSVQS